jgi:hypothetical protein
VAFTRNAPNRDFPRTATRELLQRDAAKVFFDRLVVDRDHAVPPGMSHTRAMAFLRLPVP